MPVKAPRKASSSRRWPPASWRSLHRVDDQPTQVWAGDRAPTRILYFTAMARFRWWLSLARTDWEAPQHIAAMTHGRLPMDRDLQILRILREPAGARITVFGDCDPDDLLAYAMLSAAFGPGAVDYDGVTDRLLAIARRIFGEESVAASTEPFTPDEARVMRFMRAKNLVDFKRVLGPKAAAILESGRSLEIEAVIPPLLEDPKARKTIVSWIR
jgi:hypothetical protein